ncbi:MAG: DNA double-strand break repair nuclease NurA [Chloroflexota bacterium]
MSLDFQQVRDDIKKLGQGAKLRAETLAKLQETARQLLGKHAKDMQFLSGRVQKVARMYDPNLRCAMPALHNPEPLDSRHSLPELPAQATLIAADGSQILPDRHAQVQYALINIGAIQMELKPAAAPQVTIQSRLLYDEALHPGGGTLSEDRLALERDLRERQRLVELAETAPAPVISLTDGPLELWGAKDTLDGGEFEKSLQQYQAVLLRLRDLQVCHAGYVDKPAANLVTRLLEVASLQERELEDVRRCYPLQGISDRFLFNFLEPGERSAVFAMQSRSAVRYQDDLALHFFYLNVGHSQQAHLARVEAPAWVVQRPQMLDALQAALVYQCRALGTAPYPYILHRSHEAAVVTYQDADQVTQMLVWELRRSGVAVDEFSYKQLLKGGARRTRMS